MAFKPYCTQCRTWHTEQEGHTPTVACATDRAALSDRPAIRNTKKKERDVVVDDVARALCEAAGRPHNGEGNVCQCCVKEIDGSLTCIYWETFRIEARDAIIAAYKWHKKERRWPAFVAGSR